LSERARTYLLPCSCGRHVCIATQQAGETVLCECGLSLAAPTMTEIRALRPAVEASATAKPKTSWGNSQRLLAAGLLLVLLATLAEGLLFSQFPSERAVRAWLGEEEKYVRTLSPWATVAAFRQQIQHGVEMPQAAGIQTRRQMVYIGMGFVAVLGGIGLLLTGVGVARKFTSRRLE
jgi:hypothetical protein